jgi:HD-GYP domain-containing protein (c-di-GMP phosphodiesterase class II)
VSRNGLPSEKIDGISMAGSIHDIGKLSIPAEILSKPTKPTEPELSLIKEHSRKGYEIGTLYDAAAVDVCLRLFREKRYRLALW